MWVDFDPVAAASTLRARGLVKVPAAFADDAATLAQAVRRHVERRFGIVEADPSTWARQCHGAIATRRFRHPARFDAVVAPPVRAVLDDLFGRGGWREPDGARVLVTPPRRDRAWRVPTSFHLDVPIDRPSQPVPGVLLFSFFADTPPGAGGTCVVEGSHRLADAALRRHVDAPADRRLAALLRGSGEWLRQLVNAADGDPHRTQRCLAGTVVDGVPLRVVELTGRAGDVVLTHHYTLHSGAPNPSDAMRLMVSTAIGAADHVSCRR